MFSKFHFIKGYIKNLFNPRISFFAFVSSNNIIHSSVAIYRKAKVKNSTIGRYSYIGNGTDIASADIGCFCSIADNCRVGMSGHHLKMLSTSPIFTEAVNGAKAHWVEKDVNAVEEKRVTLGSDVWVGSHVLINGGVTIGHGAVIGAGAVVVKDVPPFAIVGGVPAKIIRYRFSPEIIDKLLELRWWDMNDDVLKSHIHLFQTDNVSVDDISRFIQETSKCLL